MKKGLLFLLGAVVLFIFCSIFARAVLNTYYNQKQKNVPFDKRPARTYHECAPGEVFMWGRSTPGTGKCGKIFYEGTPSQ